ncbi:uncharacterized protein LOC144031254 isoform X2 [Festucalex cinctus]
MKMKPADPVQSLDLFRTDNTHLQAVPARVMTYNGDVDTRQAVVVLSTDDEWASLVSLLKESVPDKESTSQGSFELVLDKRSVSLHRANIPADGPGEVVSRAVNGCFPSPKDDGISAFLLLIRGGHYTSGQMCLAKLLQVHFGSEAFKYLVVVSLDNAKTADTLDHALLELLDACDGRYCRLSAEAAREQVNVLVSMVDYTLAESGGGGYSQAMLDEATRRRTEDTAMRMLRQKVRKAEERVQGLRRTAAQREERRAREVEELRAKHAEERREEVAERRRCEAKKESLEEVVISHQATLWRHIKPQDDDINKLSVVLLGLSGSGKTSALNLISARAGNQYRDSGSDNETSKPTRACTRREVCPAGRRLVLVDTPELWDEDGVENLEKVKDCLALALPGPHVYLLVLQVGRFTQCESLMLAHLQKVFGRDAAEHAMVLFVHMGQGPKRSQRVHEYVAEAHVALRELVRRCGSRYYELSLATPHNGLTYPQVRELLVGIDKLAASHGGRGHVIKRFSAQELQDRKKALEDTKDTPCEDNFLLIED